MASERNDGDLAPSDTEGFKLGEKKTLDEYAKLDQEDEALNRWKLSLGLGVGEPIADREDPRRCIIKSLTLEVQGRPDITIDVSAPGAVETLKKKPFIIKEGSHYKMKVIFVVQHELLSGLRYEQIIKRKGIPFGSRHSDMIGSFAPNTTDKETHETYFAAEEAPSGMMARGHYEAVSTFKDDDNNTHLEFEWSFDITKEWK